MIIFTAMTTTGKIVVANSPPHDLKNIYALGTIALVGGGEIIAPFSIILLILIHRPHRLPRRVHRNHAQHPVHWQSNRFFIYTNLLSRINRIRRRCDCSSGNRHESLVSPNNLTLIVALERLASNAQFAKLEEEIATNPLVLNKKAFPITISYAQEAFALAYRWPY
ncbi:hypothetical protein K505DRAFT_393731 [Melanomma pulvis-pyrius CBS 109.77]|uniref:Uncharacterized protein n=1 Tax=Melanomma pulvis-pyrius CBS 109.77 TaxID=1314802 RepID=A0A6A6WYA7_9PLEO|nr:hypothetical protein K505DRAFT_393731 [Melanomma pulvis-pyrius CBS 109.77]